MRAEKGGRWPSGARVMLGGEDFYRIAHYDRLPPFFMTVVSNAEHWMFVSSNGALTAGRRNPDLALFPYYTDDKIRDMAEVTGSKTILAVQNRHGGQLWEPFSERGQGAYRTQRNLYKNFRGNKLIFEEINEDLSLSFRYGWFNSERFGFVRQAWLSNSGRASVRLKLLDGLQNLMPCGTGSQFNLEYSTLLDAYKRSELSVPAGLGLFRLSAIPIDRPEPAEALRTNVAWSLGLRPERILLSSKQLGRFREGIPLKQETDVRGERGGYFVSTSMSLRSGQSRHWLIVADVGLGATDVARLNRCLRKPTGLRKLVQADIDRGTRELERIVAGADGLQTTARAMSDARHYSNTLFNVMRGGTFLEGYKLEPQDLHAFVSSANKEVARRHASFFRNLSEPVCYPGMVAAAAASGDPQLERLCREYLPLTFSRRHGDPSRPWNRFSIATRNPDGTPILNYEGNWRDIFQNWEALAVSFPRYVSGMICRFLNASTADGYNPYRLTRSGIDWEVVSAHDPWSYIGYWGDHQVIYLLKLLESLKAHEPAALRGLLTREIFAYANVPYRIKPYEALLTNPKDTVVFDRHLHDLALRRAQAVGSDGKLMWDKHGQVRLVNLAEKLLVPLLVKLSNFVPDAGIWLNTQRPEWNDANNALVGNGASMVTVYYVRRHLEFCRELFREQSERAFALSDEVAEFFGAMMRALKRHRPLPGGAMNDRQRRRVLDDVGRAGSRYRQRIYERGFSGRKSLLAVGPLLEFFDLALKWTSHSIRSNRRPDKLYHAYNLIRLESGVRIRRLYEMLEGQVAVLSSGQLSAEESLALLKALKHSAMYRADQRSYLLYPNRELPRFVEKNRLPVSAVRHSRLLRKLLTDGNKVLVERDIEGRVHFNPEVTNARDIKRLLDQLASSGYAKLVRREGPFVLELFERLFDHESFTGRSGTFFGYEGLGCIYWHMVSKLRLAAQETYFRALEAGFSSALLRALAQCYYDIRAGIGDYKTPEGYGGFPIDPYSHTPAQGGARQPGLTGQVKEDFLCRMGELGVWVRNGELRFRPALLRREEFLVAPTTFEYWDPLGNHRRLPLKAGSLAYTYCQVPIIYHLARKSSLVSVRRDGSRQSSAELRLDSDTSRLIFERTGEIQRMEVSLCL